MVSSSSLVLSGHQIIGQVLRQVSNGLKNREKVEVINGHFSHWRESSHCIGNSGVLTFINDLEVERSREVVQNLQTTSNYSRWGNSKQTDSKESQKVFSKWTIPYWPEYKPHFAPKFQL